MNSRVFEYLLNLLFWVVTAWLISNSFSIQAQEFELVDGVETVSFIRNESLLYRILLCIGLAALLFYANLWNLLRLRQQEVSRAAVVLWGVGMLVGASLLYVLLEHWWTRFPELALPAALRMGILLFYFAVSVAYGLAKVWWITNKQQQELVLARKQAELQLLRNQLQPHFLFNALNNLLALVDQRQSPLLADSIERLSQLLRYVIDETRKGQVGLRQEIDFIRNYAEVQLLRFEPGEVSFNLTVGGAHDEQQLEPGLFIPFVENAFKYGTEPEQQSTIYCSFDLTQAGVVFFSISNQVRMEAAASARKGTGIESTQRRLALLYPNRHQLKVQRGTEFVVELKISTHDSHHR